MDLADFREATRDRVGVPAEDGLFTDEVLTRLVNRAVHKLSGEYDWAWLERTETITTANTQRTYGVADDYARTILLVEGEYKPLRRIPIDEAEFWGEANTGQPKAFAHAGVELLLVPTPDGVYELSHRYLATESDLESDDDTPLAPEPWHESILEYTISLAYKRGNNPAEAEAALAHYSELVKKMQERGNEDAQTAGGGQGPPAPALPAKVGP